MEIKRRKNVKQMAHEAVVFVKSQYGRYDKWRTTRYLEKINKDAVVREADLEIDG